ncbi:hypothetical protein VM1G_09109 [Cytospora mali]|uniref:Allantoate permease n=1 Tax=Cytospora mali TaxID=578113 RepID=A0A194WAD3_CYTMA|nr:hypothetical protein VM1G_09109 [Valsa mali]
MKALRDSDAVQPSGTQSENPGNKQENFTKKEANVAYDSQQNSGSDDDDQTVYNNPFHDPEVVERWVATYEEVKYECRHVFDPTLAWSEEEEKKIIRKLDWHVCLWACIMFFALQLDRGNLSQALSDHFLTDLNMTTNDYNLGNALFLACFLIAELPSQLVSKKVGPDIWVPTQMVLWSIVASCQCVLAGRSSFLVTRCLLGALEGGFIPDLVLWLSYFYKVIEGLVTLVVGLASFFLMPASAVQTKAWYRPNGWFTDKEVAIVVNRVLRDDPSKGDMHNRQAITPARLWEALKDYDLWPIYILGLLVFIPPMPVSYYITLTLRSMGFSTFNTNLLTIPISVAHIITLLSITRLSEYLNERTFVAMIQPIWTLPCLIVLRYWPGAIHNAWGTYAVTAVLLAYPYCHAVLVAWTSKNSNNVGARGVSSAIYNMSVQAGNIISSFIYRSDDAPYYHRGNTTLIAINVLVIVCFLLTKVYYVWRNKQKDRIWSSMSEQERKAYTTSTQLQGSRRLDFRFAH